METPRFSFAFAISAITLLLTLCGGLWHLGYWSTFKFNFFEFANLTDLFKSSIYPFFSKVWIFVGICIYSLSASYVGSIILTHLSKQQNQKEIQKKSDNITKPFIGFIDIVIGISLAVTGGFIILTNARIKWDILPFSLSVALILLSYKYKILSKVILNESTRLLFITLFAVYPTFNFFLAKKASYDVFSGPRRKIIVDFKSSDSTLTNAVMYRPLLGATSEYLFILEGFERVRVVKKESFTSFSVEEELGGRLPSIELEKQRLRKEAKRDSLNAQFDTTKMDQ